MEGGQGGEAFEVVVEAVGVVVGALRALGELVVGADLEGRFQGYYTGMVLGVEREVLLAARALVEAAVVEAAGEGVLGLEALALVEVEGGEAERAGVALLDLAVDDLLGGVDEHALLCGLVELVQRLALEALAVDADDPAVRRGAPRALPVGEAVPLEDIAESAGDVGACETAELAVCAAAHDESDEADDGDHFIITSFLIGFIIIN